MAETASVLCPDKRVLIPDADAGCSLADSITAEQLRGLEGSAPRRRRRHVRQHHGRGQGRDRLLLHLGQRRRGRRATSTPSTARTPRSCSVPTCSSAPTWRRRSAARCASGTASATCTRGSSPQDIAAVRAAHPDADFLIHPECGCSTSVMEYVAAGDVAAEGVRMLSTGGMLDYARRPSALGWPAHGDRGHRDRHAAPAAPGRPGRRLRRRQRGRELPLHEDDHAAQAPRCPARRRARGQGARRDRRARCASRSNVWSSIGPRVA